MGRKRLRWLESGLAVLVVLPMIAIGLLSAWLLEAERAALAAERAERSRQAATAAAVAANDAVSSSMAHLQTAMWQAYASGGAAAVRNAVLADPLILLVTIHDQQGHRLLPAEGSMLMYFEKAVTEQFQNALTSARMRLNAPNEMIWSGNAFESGSGVIACQRLHVGSDVCLVVDADRLRAFAADRIAAAFSATSERPTLVDTHDNASSVSPTRDAANATPWIALAPPLSGWGIAIDDDAATKASWMWLAMMLAAIFAAVLAVAGLVFWTQSQQAAQARKRVEMLAQVSHELRTPLANLKLYGSLIGQRGAQDADIQRYCGVIDVETDRLATLIDNALICARDGYVSRSTTQVANPDDTARSVVERFAPLLNSAETITLDLTVDKAVRFDVSAYESILINLLDNARKHAQGTRICVRTELRDDFLVLSVEDNGVGLPREVRDDLYTAFARGSRRDGFGLGLAACYVQVRAAGGDIQYSDIEPGARFVARLPVRGTANTPPSSESVARQGEAIECAS